jgi:hypothetical protein
MPRPAKPFNLIIVMKLYLFICNFFSYAGKTNKGILNEELKIHNFSRATSKTAGILIKTGKLKLKMRSFYFTKILYLRMQ